MIFGDTHIHSTYSADCETPMEEDVKAAIDAGLPYICFTDHIDYDYPYPDEVFEYDMAAYLKNIAALREVYGDRIAIYAGAELGMQKHLGPRYEALIRRWPLDFCIGSQHLVDNCDPYYPETFRDRRDSEIYRAFFEETLNDIRSFHSFDALGHLDYIVRYGKERRFYHYSEYADVLDEILKLLVKYNIALEVNTAGLKKHLGFANPQPEVHRRYRELGGTLITVGSDAHRTGFIGYGFEETAKLLKSIGFSHVVYYKAHRPNFVKL